MMILGIEASAKVAGAAVYKDGQIVAEHMQNGTLTHSETLMPMVDAVMREAGAVPADLDAVAVTNGPGSFTGLRIGAATAKGLALALGIPVIPVPTLEALAANIAPTDRAVICMMDARRHQVYAAAYQVTEEGIENLLPPDTYAPDDLAAWLAETGWSAILVGDGVPVYGEYLRNYPGINAAAAPANLMHASAGTVAAMGARIMAAGGAIGGSDLTIEYLRKPQAEREREERLNREAGV